MLWPQKHVLALLGSRQNAMPLNDLNVSVILVVVDIVVQVVVVVAAAVAWLCCAI